MAQEDFCFTYYDGDAARDKAHMTRLCRGAYDDIISMQRKVGHLTIDAIQMVLSSDFDACWKSLLFILKQDPEGKYYIGWVDMSLTKMKKNNSKQKEKIEQYWDDVRTGKVHRNKKSIPQYKNNDNQNEPKIENEYEEEIDIKDNGVGKGEEFLWTEIVKSFFNDYNWKEKFCRDKNIEMNFLEKRMHEFISNLELKEDLKELKELKNHFTNWYNKKHDGTTNSLKKSDLGKKSGGFSILTEALHQGKQ